MSNSPLVDFTLISPNSSPRTAKIDTITIHHMAGNLTVERCGEVFQNTGREASSNYGVGSDGRVGLYVDESRRAWTSSNGANDNRAVTIEVANDGGSPDWHVSDKALAATIDLCVDICRRNGIARLNYTGDTSGNLTMHKWFANTACPGPYLGSKFPHIAEQVNKRLGAAQEPQAGTEQPGSINTPGEDEKTLWRVQVGAYKVKANAERMRDKLKAAGNDTYIVQVDGLYKVQVGAFSKRANAEALRDKLIMADYSAFITDKGGQAVSTSTTTTKKSIEEIARDVIQGDYGNGAEREALLQAKGYDPDEVQTMVNKLLE